MKIRFYLFLLIAILLSDNPIQAQTRDTFSHVEFGLTLNKTKKNLRLSMAAGYWLTPHLNTQLYVFTPQRKILLFIPSSTLNLPGGRMEKASIKLGSISGINVRAYSAPKRNFFVGLGLSRQSYLVTAKSVFDNDAEFSSGNALVNLILDVTLGADRVIKVKTSGKAWGINWQLGYSFPVKHGRYEFSIRQNYLLIENQKYEYQTSSNSSEVKSRLIKSDFPIFPIGLEISYIADLF